MTFGPHGREARATRLITERASRRIGVKAFDIALTRERKVSTLLYICCFEARADTSAMQHVTIIHKSNVLSITDGLFRDTVKSIPNHPDYGDKYLGVKVAHQIVDSAVYRCVSFLLQPQHDKLSIPSIGYSGNPSTQTISQIYLTSSPPFQDLRRDGRSQSLRRYPFVRPFACSRCTLITLAHTYVNHRDAAAALVGSLGVVPSVNAGDSFVMGEPCVPVPFVYPAHASVDLAYAACTGPRRTSRVKTRRTP